MRLDDLGWDPVLAFHSEEVGLPGLVPGRLATVDRGRAVVLTAAGAVVAAWRYPVELAGEGGAGVVPAVGDWVLVRPEGDLRTLRLVLPRRTLLARGAEKTARTSQPLAANVDVVFAVCGLDGDFNLRRIERYLALARSGGAQAVVVLSKADLARDPDEALRRAERSSAGMTVLAVSAVSGAGVDALQSEIAPGHTAVLVGSSGAGKSTLINRLLGEQRQRTGAVRAHDDRGRHVTTRRELLLLPKGGMVIDTPGLREVGMLADEQAVLSVFPEIEALAASCRFQDCTHTEEPGCAVRRAAEDGTLDPERLSSFHRLIAEQQSASRRADEHARRSHERATMGRYRKQLRDVYRFKGKK